jgi:anti-repressor protein
MENETVAMQSPFPVKVTSNSDRITVSARELHDYLDASERYSTWIERMNQYGFSEGIDYVGCKTFNALAHQELEDAQITIDMAKEICMLQRSEKGKAARKYFIQLEKDWNTPEKVMARALDIAHREIESLGTQVKEMKPKALFADAVSTSNTSVLIGDLAKILRGNNIEIGQKRLFQWLRDNNYIIKSGGSKNMPTQKSMELGLMQVKEGSYINGEGQNITTKTTKITGKGQIYFINKFLNCEETDNENN